MASWITVKVFNLPQDAYIAEGSLKANGIETFLKDELTVQTDNFLSHAVGGVKLQVMRQDVKRAVDILTAAGYIDHNNHDEDLTLKQVGKMTDEIKLFGKPLYDLGILELAGIIILVLAIPIVIYMVFFR